MSSNSEFPAIPTRFPSPLAKKKNRTDEEKIELIARNFKEIMEVLGLDLADESLAKTPTRVAKMYVNEIFSGLKEETFPQISFIENKYSPGKSFGNIVFMKVNFTSFCEHHFVPMTGSAYVAYLPRKKLIGLSKIPRIVRYFARRPQVQERLTAQIADCLSTLLETPDVAVSLNACHFCVVARGVEERYGDATTNVFLGEFESNPEKRGEFFEAIKRS